MNDPVQQDQELAFTCLAALATETDGEPPQRVDTHANVLFIGKTRVYKIKRAVTYPFLDYSTVELRYRYCASEVLLNRRTAPDLYLGIIPLLKTQSGITAGNLLESPDPRPYPQITGDVVDWAVVMQRFDDANLFDRLAEDQRLTPGHLKDLGHSLATFHNRADAIKNDWCAIEGDVLKDNLEEIAAAAWLSSAKVDAHRQNCRNLFTSLAEKLVSRATDGFVRQCHGDVHLRNIVLINGRATLFDCIEFSDDFSQIDTLYDLAFLLMDLEHRGMSGAACRVLNKYLEETGDYDGVGLLPFYTTLRAQIRCKIEIATVAFSNTSTDVMAHKQEAEAYFNLAAKAVDRPTARLIAFGGPSGSGKSTLAVQVADRLAKDFGPVILILRSDAIRKELWGVAETEQLPNAAYATDVSVKVYQVMLDRAQTALGQGLTVMLDATHTHPDSRNLAENLARDSKVPFQGFWVTAPDDVLFTRVAARINDASDADEAVVRAQLKDNWGDISWPEIDTSDGAIPKPDGSGAVDRACTILSSP